MSAVDPSAVPALAAVADTIQLAPEAASVLGTSLVSSGGAAGFLWLFLRSKFDSITLLFSKYDALDRSTTEKLATLGREMAANRLADAKEFATRAELTRMVEKLEDHFDKRFDALEHKLETKENK